MPVHPPPYGCYRDVNVERPSKTQAPARYGTKVDDYGTKVDDCSAIAGPRYPDAGPRYPDVGYSSYTPASSGYYGTGGGGGSMASGALLGGAGGLARGAMLATADSPAEFAGEGLGALGGAARQLAQCGLYSRSSRVLGCTEAALRC